MLPPTFNRAVVANVADRIGCDHSVQGLRPDLPDNTATAVKDAILALLRSAVKRRAVHIPIGIQGHATGRSVPVVKASEIVEIGINPAAVQRRQLEDGAHPKRTMSYGRAVEI